MSTMRQFIPQRAVARRVAPLITVVVGLMLAAGGSPAQVGLGPAGSVSYEIVRVDNGGKIQGKVIFTGAKPAARKVVPTKDPEACGTAVREIEQITVGPDNSVSDAVVILANIERGKAWQKPEARPVVENLKCDFVPRVQVIPKGSDVEFKNSDPVFHNVHTFLDKKTLQNLPITSGQHRVGNLTEPGLVRAECDSHGWMLGWVYVAANPYYAVTSKDGNFTLEDVPPGDYTLVVWQEYAGSSALPVTVKDNDSVSVIVDLTNGSRTAPAHAGTEGKGDIHG